MRNSMPLFVLAGLLFTGLIGTVSTGCGTDAVAIGISAECGVDDDCAEDLTCLQGFRGGYCGSSDCVTDDDCAQGGQCVLHDDGVNYCFLICTDKSQCNENRSAENEANCSANIESVGGSNAKACVPPSG